MDPHWRHPYGLRPTLRHLMILVVHFALIFGLIARIPQGIRHESMVFLLLPGSPPLLAVLVLILDRPSPAKYWLCGWLASLSFPVFVLWCDSIGVFAWRDGWWNSAMTPILFLLNTFGLVALFVLLGRLPRPCPDCGWRSLLPLGGFKPRIFWCASCGFQQKAGGSVRTR
jgi:hypothetical protein